GGAGDAGVRHGIARGTKEGHGILVVHLNPVGAAATVDRYGHVQVVGDHEGLVVIGAAQGQSGDFADGGGVVDAVEPRVGGTTHQYLEVGAVDPSGDGQVLGPAVHAQDLEVHVEHRVVLAVHSGVDERGDKRRHQGVRVDLAEAVVPPAFAGGR